MAAIEMKMVVMMAKNVGGGQDEVKEKESSRVKERGGKKRTTSHIYIFKFQNLDYFLSESHSQFKNTLINIIHYIQPSLVNVRIRHEDTAYLKCPF